MSGHYCSDEPDSPTTEPRVHRSRRIRSTSRGRLNIHSDEDKNHGRVGSGCATNSATGRNTRDNRRTQVLPFQWTDFDIDASLEFISGEGQLELKLRIGSDSTMVAKSQDSSDSEGEFFCRFLKFRFLSQNISFSFFLQIKYSMKSVITE